MRRQRRRDTKLEIEIRRALHSMGYRFRVDYRVEPSLRARPDIVFTRKRVAVFVDGCFWHGCPEHGTQPTNNAEWWQEKLAANVARDRRTTDAFEGLGWSVVRVWEHEHVAGAVDRIVAICARRDVC